MSTDAELHRVAKRGGDAARVLGDPMLKEAFDAVRRHLLNSLMTCANDDREAQYWYRAEYKAVDAVEAALRGFAESGKVAIEELARRTKEKESVRDKFRRWAA